MNKISLNGEWYVSCSEQGVPSFKGSVPGSVLNDIKNSDFSESDFFWRDNAEKCQAFENYDFKYTKTFNLEKSENEYNLVFENLDTYCEIYLNSRLVAKTANGFISHEFSVTRLLNEGENTLVVYFHSPIKAVDGMPRSNIAAFTSERLNTRRMQCTYGWDWTMRFVTCGMGGNVYLEEITNETTIDNTYIYTKNIDSDSAQVGLDVNFKHLNKGLYNFSVYFGDTCVKKLAKYCSEDFVRLNFEIENPKLWWPVGYGEPNIYTLKIDDGENVIHTEEFGIRTVKIMQITDQEGSEYYNKCLELKKSIFSEKWDFNEEYSGFILKVNGVKIMCKGANYVPCEPFEIGGNEEKLRELLKLSKEYGVNMIRVWGGGRFEVPFFYEECSRLGIMVTQDFLMACGQYPEKEEWFLEELKKEAEYASILMRNKPCLMWWSGDNENATYGNDQKPDYRGKDSAYKAIAPVIYKNDPYREFLPSSPYGGDRYAANTVGTTHNTNFMGHFFKYIREAEKLDVTAYIKNHGGRFIAEEPTMGAIELKSLKKFMTDEDIFGESLYMWDYHTKDNPPMDLFGFTRFYAEKMLGAFKDGKDRFMKLKYIQYEWVRISLEQARREKWFCSGIIYWMLNDCWPAASGWALLDYYNYPKAALYSFKRCAKDVMATIDRNKNKSFSLYVSNDTQKPCEVTANCYILNYKTNEKKPLFEKTLVATNDENARFDFNTELKENEMLICDICGENISDRCFYKQGTQPIVETNAVKIIEKGEDFIRLSADSYVHAVVLEGDCFFEDNYFNMTKGEEKTVKFKSEKSCDITVEGYTLEEN